MMNSELHLQEIAHVALAHQLKHIHKIVYIKTFKIAPTCFDPKIIFRDWLVRHTRSGVPFTQYDMLPQHQINIRN